MPVVIPLAASIDTVKAVSCLLLFVLTIWSSFNLSQCSSVNARQIRPLPCIAIKLMASGDTFSAGKIKSPSFSLSSSSINTTIFPFLRSDSNSFVVLRDIFLSKYQFKIPSNGSFLNDF